MGDRQSFKLQQARDKHGRVISARQIGQKPEPFTRPLRCPYCEHEVIAQPEQPRISKKGKPFTRGAHFALAKEKEPGRAAEHLAPCPLRTDHTVHAIARTSQGLAELRSGGLQLRLVLAPTSDTKAPLLPPAGSPLLAPPADPVNLKIHSVDPALPPAVTSAARIAQLLALYGDDPENVERFTVKHPGLCTPVPWTDFCFGPEPGQLARLYQHVAAGTVRHPVAVLGQVTQIRTTTNVTSCRIAMDIPTGLSGPLAHAEVYLRVGSDRHPLLEPLAEGARVLALAAPDVAFKLWKPDRKGLGHQVVLWPRAHWQIAHWNVDGAGVPTAPRLPSPLSEPVRPRTRRRTPAARPFTSSHRPAPSPPKTAPRPPAAVPGPPQTAAPAAEVVPLPEAAPALPAVPPPPVTPPPPAPVEPPAIPPAAPPLPVSPPAGQRTRRPGFLARWRRR